MRTEQRKMQTASVTGLQRLPVALVTGLQRLRCCRVLACSGNGGVSSAAVFYRPLTHFFVSALPVTRPPVPWAVVLPRPMQHQVPAPSGVCTSRVQRSHGQPCSRNHLSTSSCPPLRHLHIFPPYPTGSRAPAPTATPPGALAKQCTHHRDPRWLWGTRGERHSPLQKEGTGRTRCDRRFGGEPSSRSP